MRNDETHAGRPDYIHITGRHIRHAWNRCAFGCAEPLTNRHMLNTANFTRRTPPLKLFAKGILELSKSVWA